MSQTITISHSVSQNISAVELTDQNSIQYLGNLVGDDGLSVDANQTVTVNGRTCQDARRVEYDQVTEDNDNTAEVDFIITRTCAGAAACNIQWTGTASRVSGGAAAATPTPIPGTTPTPGGPTTVSGGCAEMNPNPAAGTYSGDGGCGISDAAFREETQGAETVVVLEPFGGNGATSFVINSTNSSTALSRRNDLTVNGVSGYTCSLTCSPPGTFTATCTKEGGTSCIEKF